MELRPQQARIATEYTGGRMAVSAVPGSGKTHTLAALVAELLWRGLVRPDSEVLVVTFTNSAVNNVKARIRRALREHGLSDTGYRVFTLHSLANAIVRERPDLAGVASDYGIDDELSGNRSMPDAARWFIQQEHAYWQSFLPSELTQQQRFHLEGEWTDATVRLGAEVTKLAKNLRLTPADVRALIAGPGDLETSGQGDPAQQRSSPPRPHVSTSPFLKIGAAIYDRYDSLLRVSGRLDFDDLIWAAIRALNNDEDFRARLAHRWQFILEDEAQDSTPLQEEILKLLLRAVSASPGGGHGNWVRVGDPNQAIMTTFTASDVRFFRAYKIQPDVQVLPLSVSGRSAQPIIDLANNLVHWTTQHHPEPEVRREALSVDEIIQPAPADDPQHNPPPSAAHIHLQAFSDEDVEAQKVAQSAARFVIENSDKTCAILTPTNYFGQSIVQALEPIQAQHPERQLYQDQLRNAQPVRDVARVLGQAVRFCGQPTNMNALVDLRSAMIEIGVPKVSGDARNNRIKTILRSARPERLLFPSSTAEPALPERIQVKEQDEREIYQLAALTAKWLRASVLPVDQLMLAIAQDIFTQDNDLAIAHSLALSLRRYMSANPEAQLADVARELDEIANNRQRYLSNSLIEAGFEPVKGQITVTTMHKAKGLEWDRAYLTSMDEIEFPHDADGDFRGQAWYLNGHDPAIEAREQLEMLVIGRDEPKRFFADTDLVRQAHLEYISERLRLLYVGITRARTDLIMSFSHQRLGRDNRAALALREILQTTD